jgi:hypothetical protein
MKMTGFAPHLQAIQWVGLVMICAGVLYFVVMTQVGKR